MVRFGGLWSACIGMFSRSPAPRRRATRGPGGRSMDGAMQQGAERLEERWLLSAAVSEFFVISAADSQVYEQRINADATPSGQPFLVAPGGAKSMVTGKDAVGNDLIFIKGFDDQVYRLEFGAQGTPLGGYSLVQTGGVLTLELGSYGTVTTQNATPNPELFVRGFDNQVYVLPFDATTTPIGTFTLVPGAVKAIEVSTSVASPFTPTLFAIGFDNQVYEQHFTSTGVVTGSYTLTQPGAVKAIETSRDAFGGQLLYVIGFDDQVYGQKFSSTGTSLGPYALVKQGSVLSIEVGNDPGTKRPELFAIGIDQQLYAIPLDNIGNATTGYTLTTPGMVMSVVTGHTLANRVFILALGNDSQVYAQDFDATGASVSSYFLASTGAAADVQVPTTD